MLDGTPLARFLAQIDRDSPGGCWLWRASLDRYGYGQFMLPGSPRRIARAHRLAYRLFVGPVPDGRHLDHTCHNAAEECPGGAGCLHRRCVNPAHLEPVTQRENIQRGRHTNQDSRCSQGHDLTVFGQISERRRRVDGSIAIRVICGICRRERDRERYHRRRPRIAV